MHAVQRLYHYRKSIATTQFKARGNKVDRCEQCRVAKANCICELVPSATSNAGFVLLMYNTEVLKPSNTGRLIADIFSDTYAFLWSRTEVAPALLQLLNNECWQPYVIFPKQYAAVNKQVIQDHIPNIAGKRPLFILLDGSWREAKKMFRKSPYIADFPIVSFTPDQQTEVALNTDNIASNYGIRIAAVNNQLATAEVAAKVLAMAGEIKNSKLLELWFDVFSYRYQKSKCQPNVGNVNAVADLKTCIENF